MPFFDFHVHPTLKCFFSEDNPATGQQKLSPWENIDVTKIPWAERWCSEFENILQSQSNLQQIINSQGNLIVVALYMPERAMTTDPLIIDQANNTALNAYLQPSRLTKINSGTLKPYPDLLYEDLEQVLLNPARFGINDKKVVPLTKGVVYDPDDGSSIYVAFSIEGCHTLLPTLDQTQFTPNTVNDVLNNLDELSGKYPIVSVNVTHLQQFPFCNHAYGILFLDSADFIPTGNRISDDGITIIKHCYDRNIIIDIKHTSLAARRMLIDDLRSNPAEMPTIQPLVCTHAGFTGISYQQINNYSKFKPVDGTNYSHVAWGKPAVYSFAGNKTAFNPSSINLYDEDILAILQSGGMIGLNMDKRILGYTLPDPTASPQFGMEWDETLAFEEEFVSMQEAGYFQLKPGNAPMVSSGKCITIDQVNGGGDTPDDLTNYHLCHFMSHIFHLIFVANMNGYDAATALTQVCIGSDFDGLINPINPCMTAEERQGFKNDFITLFPKYANENGDKVTLPPGFDINVFAEQLFYENGKIFLLGRLNKIYS